MKVSNAAQQLQNNLDEMKRRDDLESLRVHLIFEICFPPNKNQETAVISMDELKKLARAWKLHERRNFWKTHTEKDAMVDALLQHLMETGKVKGNSSPSNATVAPVSPSPPVGNRRSSLSGKQTSSTTNSRTSTIKPIDNYCGKKYFVREVTDTELTITSRFSANVPLDTELSELIAQWRLDDMNNGLAPASETKESGGFVRKRGLTINNNPREHFSNAAMHVVNMLETSHAMQTGMSTQERLLKHRKLAFHLAYFSLMSEEDKKSKVTLNTVKSYLTVCDTDDWIVASHCVIGLCNLASTSGNRVKLIELNAIHKFSTLLPLIKLDNPIQAGLTLLYYLSCELELEDRIFDSGFQLMVTYCARNTSKTGGGATAAAIPTELLGEVSKYQLISLNTLNNILPAIDRIRVTELIISITRDCVANITAGRDSIESEHLHVLVSVVFVLKNCGLFTNIHNTLFLGDIVEMLTNITGYIKDDLDAEDDEQRNTQENVSVTIAKILNSLLYSQDNCSHYLSVDFINIIVDLFALATDYPQLCKYLLRCVSVLSCSVKLQENVTDGDIVTTVTNVILDMPLDFITSEIARDASVFMYNITCTKAQDLLQRLVEYQVPHALIKMIKYSISKNDLDITVIAAKSLHNLIYDPRNSVALAKDILDPLIEVINRYHDLGAAQALYNLSCQNDNDVLLYQYELHLILLNNIKCTDNIDVKSMYIIILVQMSSNITCIHELVEKGVCHTFASKIVNIDTIEIWDSVSQFICAIVSIYYKESSGFRSNVPSILKLLKVLCIKQAQEIVLINCAVIVSYISIIMPEFTPEIDNIVRTILMLSDHEKVLESISITLYNYSCYCNTDGGRESDIMTPSLSVKALLKDSYYLNIMVRMMRKGNNDVQLNIANAIMNMAAIPRCTALLKESNNNILSDLVVIALLRTSSMSIKQVCSQIFYNMLCHDESRTRLIASEFWWGLCRLCRTDDFIIRNLFAKIMFECSVHAELIPIIREHNILTCIKEVVDMTDTGPVSCELVDKYMVCVQNMLHHFQPVASGGSLFTRNESMFLVRLCTNVLLRPVSHQSIGVCIKLLLKCSLQVNVVEDKVDLEYIGLDIANTLFRSSHIWMSSAGSNDVSLPLIISQLILQLCKISNTFTRLVALAEVPASVGSAEGDDDHPGTVHTPLAPLLMKIYTASSKRLVGENILLVIFIYMIRHGPAASSLIKMPIFNPLIVDILVTNTQYTLPIKKLAILTLCYIAQDCLVLQPTLFTASLVNSVMLNGQEYIADVKTRKHFLHFIEMLSTHPLSATNLFQSNIYKVLSKHIEQCRKYSQGEVLAAIELTSIIIKNSSLHLDLLEAMIVSPSGLPAILELMSNDQITESSAWNLCVLLCKASLHSKGFRDDYALSPSFVLALCEKLLTLITEGNIVRRIKFVISIVLELYSNGLQVDPTFIQEIFLEMQSVENMRLNRKIPVEMRDEPFSSASILDTSAILKKVDTDYLQVVQSNIHDAALSYVLTMASDGDDKYKKWAVYVLRKVRTIEHTALTMKKTVPFFFFHFEMVELYPVDSFQKIVRTYPNILAHDESADDDDIDDRDESDDGDGVETQVNERSDEDKTVATPEYKDDFTVESRVSKESSYLNDDFEEEESVAAKK